MLKGDSWAGGLVQELFQRKVDTILTDGITGRAMPDPVTALLDIHNTYFRKLIALRVVDLKVPRIWDGFVDDKGWLLPNEAARAWLVAMALEGLGKPGLKPADQATLLRIVSTCRGLEPIVAQIQQALPAELNPPRPTTPVSPTVWPGSVMDGADPKLVSRMYYAEAKPQQGAVELNRADQAALSKAWELGTDSVAMQTIALLDGDIITRITEQYTADSYAVVRQIHKEAVNLSFTTWELLVKSVGSFVDALFSRKQ